MKRGEKKRMRHDKILGGSTIEVVFAGMRDEVDLGEHTF